MLEKTKLDQDVNAVEQSTKITTYRLRLVVYLSLMAFVTLAVYGFYLIHNLTTDVGRMAKDIHKMTQSVSTNMDRLSNTVDGMSGKMTSLVIHTQTMSETMQNLDKHTNTMSSSVVRMSDNTYSMADTTQQMAAATNNMQQDLWSLNNNISTPLSLFNKFIPWSNNDQGRFPGSQAQTHTPLSYYPYYYYPPAYLQNQQNNPITTINPAITSSVDNKISPPTSNTALAEKNPLSKAAIDPVEKITPVEQVKK